MQGNVSVTDYAQISAPAGDGIRAFNFGTGNTQVTVEPGVIISAGRFGVAGNANGGGNVQITNNGNVTGTSAGLEATAVTSGALTGTITITNNGTIANSAGAGSQAICITKPTGASVTIDNNGTITGNVGLGSGTTFYNNAAANWNAGSITDNGALVIAGTGSMVSISNGLTVGSGSGSTGSLTVASGSSLNVDTSLSASAFLTVGGSGNATATVQSGGTVNVYGMFIGLNAGSSGTVTVDGTGTSLQSLDLSLTSAGAKVIMAGYSGTGSLTVSGGASVSADAVNIGQQTGSQGTVTVTGAGTTLTTTSGFYQNLQIGSSGAASFTISNGAAVTTTTMTVAADAVEWRHRYG